MVLLSILSGRDGWRELRFLKAHFFFGRTWCNKSGGKREIQMRGLIIGILALLLAGCITGEQVREVGVGMSRADVVGIMGAPDGVQVNGNTEVLKYANRLMSGFSWDRTDYFVTLTNGQVSGYGNGEVRQNAPPQIPTYIPGVTPPPQQQFQNPGMMCTKTREAVTGLTKQCVYNCAGSQVIQTVNSVELCPLTINRQ